MLWYASGVPRSTRGTCEPASHGAARLVCTKRGQARFMAFGVPSSQEFLGCLKTNNPLQDRHFRARSSHGNPAYSIPAYSPDLTAPWLGERGNLSSLRVTPAAERPCETGMWDGKAPTGFRAS